MEAQLPESDVVVGKAPLPDLDAMATDFRTIAVNMQQFPITPAVNGGQVILDRIDSFDNRFDRLEQLVGVLDTGMAARYVLIRNTINLSTNGN